jgi:hypothetical protein
MSQDFRRRLHTILRVLVKPRLFGRLFTRLSFDADERATLAHLLCLILLARPIYSHLHVAWQSGRQSGRHGNSVRYPFYVTTSLEAGGVPQPTT